MPKAWRAFWQPVITIYLCSDLPCSHYTLSILPKNDPSHYKVQQEKAGRRGPRRERESVCKPRVPAYPLPPTTHSLCCSLGVNTHAIFLLEFAPICRHRASTGSDPNNNTRHFVPLDTLLQFYIQAVTVLFIQ